MKLTATWKIIVLSIAFMLVAGMTMFEFSAASRGGGRDEGEPELVILGVRAEEPIVYLNENNKMWLTIENRGDGDSKRTTVDIFAVGPDGSEEFVRTVNYGNLRSGTDEKRPFHWKPSEGGIHYLKLEASGTYFERSSPPQEMSTSTAFSSAYPVAPRAEKELIWDGGYTLPNEEQGYDYVLPDDEGVESVMIIMRNGNLKILEHGNLVFNEGVTFVIENPDYAGQYGINISTGGMFQVYGWNDIQEEPEVFILPDEEKKTYFFINNGTIDFDGAAVLNVYGDKDDLTQPGGIQNYYGSSCTVSRSYIIESDSYSFYLVEASKSLISQVGVGSGYDPGDNNVLQGTGIYVERTEDIIIENTIVQYHRREDGIKVSGISLKDCSSPVIMNSSISNNGEGITLERVVGSEIRDNDVNNNDLKGISLSEDVYYRRAKRLTGEDSGYFGSSVSHIGDINKDGYDDFIIGDPFYGDKNVGKAYVYSGYDYSILYEFTGDLDNALFGYSVSGVGDVNNDGYDDFAVSAPNALGETGERDGKVYVYSGKDVTLLYEFEGKIGSDESLGASVSGAGDVNGDGHADLIVGAPFNSENEMTAAGRAVVYSGKDGTILQEYFGEGEGDRFGSSVSTAGDLNGDGYDDVIIGALYNREGGRYAGKVYMYLGSSTGPSKTPDWTYLGEGRSHYFGISISEAGDIDNDGYDDIIIGAGGIGHPEDDLYKGRAYVFRGIPEGLSNSPHYVFRGEDYDYTGPYQDRFGYKVSGIGDVNGDGYDDVIVRNAAVDHINKAYVFSGRDGCLLFEHIDVVRDISGVGDVNNDGIADYIIGKPDGAVDVITPLIERNEISNNSFSLNQDIGLLIESSRGNVILENIIDSNGKTGIHLDDVNDNWLSSNRISFNVHDGIHMSQSSENTISNNNVTSNGYAGIFVESSTENVIAVNKLYRNVQGIELVGSENNIFHHNNVVENYFQVYSSDYSSYENIWDDGSGEGNYWSDYEGEDQTGNGIGDTKIPHPVDDHGRGYWQLDNYPLVNPVEPSTITMQLEYTSENDGWLFLSFPIGPADYRVPQAFTSIEGAYDKIMSFQCGREEIIHYTEEHAEWKTYVPDRPEHFNTLERLNHTHGYWIHLTKPGLLRIDGYIPTMQNTSIIIEPGWNMVGYPTNIASNMELPYEIDKIGYFDENQPYSLAYDYNPSTFIFNPGEGYWIHNPTDTNIEWNVDFINKYALIIVGDSGAVDPQWYWNSAWRQYQSLLAYGLDHEHIVFAAQIEILEGVDEPGEKYVDHIIGSQKYGDSEEEILEDVKQAFVDAGDKMGPNDWLYTVWISHGESATHDFIIDVDHDKGHVTISHESYAQEYIPLIGDYGKIIFVFHPCLSGGVMPHIQDNYDDVIIITSTEEDGIDYGFMLYWNRGFDPELGYSDGYESIYGPTYGVADGRISIYEAYCYAADQTFYHKDGQKSLIEDTDEDGNTGTFYQDWGTDEDDLPPSIGNDGYISYYIYLHGVRLKKGYGWFS